MEADALMIQQYFRWKKLNEKVIILIVNLRILIYIYVSIVLFLVLFIISAFQCSNDSFVFTYLYSESWWIISNLTLSSMIMKNGQTYFKNLTVRSPQNFSSMFNHFWSLCMKELTIPNISALEATRFYPKTFLSIFQL